MAFRWSCGRGRSAVLLVALLLCVNTQTLSAEEQASGALELDASTFERTTKAASGTNGPWLVMFYASWCGACKKALPSYDAAANVLRDEGIGVAKVEAAKHNTLRQRFGRVVHAFPTIVLIRDGKMYKFTESKRDEDTLIEFARSGYRNVKPYAVPKEPSRVDRIRAQLLSLWKRYERGYQKFQRKVERKGVKVAVLETLRKEPTSAVPMTVFVGTCITLLMGATIFFLMEDPSKSNQQRQQQKESGKKAE